jgi:2'-5' RNA ligase
MTLRLFIAIEIGEQEKKSLERLQSRLRHKLPSVRWVKPGAIHLTLKFLGDIDEGEVPRIRDALAASAAKCAAFAFTLRGIGAFPNEKSPRVIWIGVDEPSGLLAALAATLIARLSSAGFPPEDRPFSPHITIGRVKERGAGEYAPVLSLFRAEAAGTTTVRELCLIRSELTPSGPVHTVLDRVPLEG